MKTPTALSVTSSQREQTSLRFQVPRLPRSNVCSTRDLENPSASVHRKRFSTPSLTLKFLCAGKLNPRRKKWNAISSFRHCQRRRPKHHGNTPPLQVAQRTRTRTALCRLAVRDGLGYQGFLASRTNFNRSC